MMGLLPFSFEVGFRSLFLINRSSSFSSHFPKEAFVETGSFKAAGFSIRFSRPPSFLEDDARPLFLFSGVDDRTRVSVHVSGTFGLPVHPFFPYNR